MFNKNTCHYLNFLCAITCSVHFKFGFDFFLTLLYVWFFFKVNSGVCLHNRLTMLSDAQQAASTAFGCWRCWTILLAGQMAGRIREFERRRSVRHRHHETHLVPALRPDRHRRPAVLDPRDRAQAPVDRGPRDCVETKVGARWSLPEIRRIFLWWQGGELKLLLMRTQGNTGNVFDPCHNLGCWGMVGSDFREKTLKSPISDNFRKFQETRACT